MNKQLNLLLIISVIVTGSCNMMGSISPLCQNKDELIFEKNIIGNWKEVKKSGDSYFIDTVSGSNRKRYLITIFSHDSTMTDTTSFYGEIVNINGWEFLDCWLNSSGNFSTKDQEDFIINKHFIFQINCSDKDSLIVSPPSSEELKKLIDDKKINLNYISIKENEYLLLDKSAALQKALEMSKKYPVLYKDKSILVRLQ